jgi:hypothetical protein
MAATTALVLASLTRVSYGCWDSALLRGHHKQPAPWLCFRCARARGLTSAGPRGKFVRAAVHVAGSHGPGERALPHRSLHTRERSYDFEARSVRGAPCLRRPPPGPGAALLVEYGRG